MSGNEDTSNEFKALGCSACAISSRFRDQAEQRPNSTALWYRGLPVSYRALDRASNRIAHQLLRRSLKKGCAVGVLMNRTPNFVAAVLGILKAGGVYLPLDAGWPLVRLQSVIEIASVSLLFVDNQDLPNISDTVDVFLIDRDQIGDVSNGNEQDMAPEISIDASDVAYINFTSGSSGTPKGVMVSHGGVTNLLTEQNYVSLSPKTITLQHASPCFDAMTFELWGALLNGGACVLYDGALPTINRLRIAINEYRVNTLLLTTALFNVVIDSAPDMLQGLQTVLTGGESQSPHHFALAKRLLPNVNIVNVYGPTEVTVLASYFRIADFDPAWTSVPIGNAINNCEILVLQPDLTRTPLGEVGEICVTGSGLALGYVGRPDLTTERFTDILDVEGREIRVYRTGDIGRIDDCGLLHFLGRADHQVKLNGFRIELEEIERALIAHPAICQAAVLIHGENLRRGLKAVLVAPSGLPDGLNMFLARTLPSYMLPSDYVVLHDLPLNTNGKVDRAILADLF
ncbi:amino acid adenylation domain-containing protein [Rhizobium rhizogenes]|uniref:amino acid adenylation domain-containing protein n=1 Tax=Rhizobium rhizogenes TaxID=359 RepID=UPI001573E204|nr:amino acid adenylation domain-containing protein [Rhizobium rhizogenes]NTF85451.1 amino acid adenylation domain-containing protein [Rhizobium rhizogenes]